MNATMTGVKCGNHAERTYHVSAAEVRDCFRNSGKGSQRVESLDAKLDDAFGERAAEQATERFFEDRGYWDARAQEDYERETGALSFQADRERWESEQDICTVSKPVDTEGVYRNPQTGDIFKVYRTVHGANQLVAKRLTVLEESYFKTVRGKRVEVKAEFVYTGKAGLRGLTASMKMTLEEGKQYGALYGVCVRCCATLTREESIERAMGPVCAGKANWA